MNNNYKKAMDKIELPDELKEKIIKTTLAQSKSISPQNNYKYKNNYKYVKRLTGIAACFIICFLSVYTVTDRATIQPVEIVSEKSSETTPTPNTDRTSEKNVVKNNPVQETEKNTPLEKKSNTEKIPDTKTVVSPDNTNKIISDSTYNDEHNTDNEIVKPKQDIETARKPSVTNDSLPPYATEKKVESKNNNISNKIISDSTDNDEHNTDNEIVKPEQDIETAKNPSATNDSLPPYATGKKVESEDNVISNKTISDSTDNDEHNTDNEIVKPEQDIETAKNPPVTNDSLPPYATEKKVESENDDISNTKTDIKQLTDELGYEIKSPQNLPEEYNTTKISVVDKNIAEITYQSETDKITYRTAKSSEDISGDDNSYTDIEKVQINNFNVTLKGNNNLYHNAGWTDNDEAFSVTSITGIEKNEMIDVVESVGYEQQENVNEEEQ